MADTQPNLEELASDICPNSPLDVGIVYGVHVLKQAGIYTVESCEGGEGHAYSRPTIVIVGSHGEGWRALSICMDYRFPVRELRRVWNITHGEVDGPQWELVFSRKLVDEVIG